MLEAPICRVSSCAAAGSLGSTLPWLASTATYTVMIRMSRPNSTSVSTSTAAKRMPRLA